MNGTAPCGLSHFYCLQQRKICLIRKGKWCANSARNAFHFCVACGILQTEEELPYIHKLIRLANQAEISGEMSEKQLSLLDTLSPLNVEARYPMHKSKLMQSLTVERCKEMIRETEALFEWLKKKC